MKRSLHTDGYVHIKNIFDIPDSIHKELVSQIDKKSSAIFNHNESKTTNDRKRRQIKLKIKSKRMIDFIAVINKYLTSINPNLTVNDWIIIKSLSKCTDQAAHCDYAQVGDILKTADEQMPLSVLVAIEPETKLHVWPKSIRSCKSIKTKSINRSTVTMNTGDIVVFRDDLVHAGSGYSNQNYRLHAYMDSPKVPRISNRTWLIAKHADQRMKDMIIV